MRHRPLARVLAVCWAVLSFALPATATYADAAIERAAAGTSQAHVESGTSAACAPVHAAECGLCQLIAHGATARRCAASVEIARAPLAPPAPVVAPASLARGAVPQPRGPPLG